MFALGLQGSPRKKGNSDLLLAMFMDALHRKGVLTHTIDVTRRHIDPCKELTVCEKKGYCPIEDDMKLEIYSLLRQADIIVAASPIFFYNVTAQLKALIDRCQTLWARKYMLKLKDPGHAVRKGFLLGVGATKGKQLFEGMHLTAKYFFDAVDAKYAGSLTFRGVEGRGQILDQPDLETDVARAADGLVADLTGRRKVLFVSGENACRSQMAAAFTGYHGGDRLDVSCAGIAPTPQINPMMVEAMHEVGIDMAFREPRALDAVISRQIPDEIITMGGDKQYATLPEVGRRHWELPDPAGQSMEMMRNIRDQIEKLVKTYISQA